MANKSNEKIKYLAINWKPQGLMKNDAGDVYYMVTMFTVTLLAWSILIEMKGNLLHDIDCSSLKCWKLV